MAIRPAVPSCDDCSDRDSDLIYEHALARAPLMFRRDCSNTIHTPNGIVHIPCWISPHQRYVNWKRLSVFFDYPVEIRKAIYTTNAIESLNASLRKITKTRRSFTNDEAVMKVLYLALHQASKKWTMPIRNWKPAMAQFEIMYQDRI